MGVKAGEGENIWSVKIGFPPKMPEHLMCFSDIFAGQGLCAGDQGPPVGARCSRHHVHAVSGRVLHHLAQTPLQGLRSCKLVMMSEIILLNVHRNEIVH